MLITPTTRVDDILRQVPQSSHVLLAFHTDCVGCHLVRFCTVEEVSLHYRLDFQSLIDALRACALPLNTAVGEGADDEPQ